MNEPDEALRRLVATDHGLDPEAAKLLSGSTLAELECSADALAGMLEAHGAIESRQKPTADLFADLRAAKEQRQRALVDALVGRQSVQQPRGDDGRYASSFDGGVRENPPPPPQSHESWLIDVLRSRKGDVGGAGF